jgi:hypothetical protein
MPVDRLKKELIFEINTDLSKVNREVAQLEKSLREQKWAEKEAKAAGDEHKLSLIQQQRALEQLKKEQKSARDELGRYANEQKKAEAAAQKLAEEQNKSSLSFKNLAEMINLPTAALGALGAASYGAVSYFSGIIEAGKEWENRVGSLGDKTNELSKATDGIISQVSLARLVKYQDELGLSQKQMESMAKAAVELARITGRDLKESLEGIIDSVLGGSPEEDLERLGILVDNITGTKLEQHQYVLKLLTDKYSDLNIVAETTIEKEIKLKNAQDELNAQVGKSIINTETYKRAVNELARAKQSFVSAIGDAIYYGGELVDELKMLWDYGSRSAQAVKRIADVIGLTNIIEMMNDLAYGIGLTNAGLAKMAKEMKGLEEVAVKSQSEIMSRYEKEVEAIVKGGPRVREAVVKERERMLAAIKRTDEKDKREKEKDEKEQQRREKRALDAQLREREKYERKLTSYKEQARQQQEQIAKNMMDSEAKRIEKEKDNFDKRRDMIQGHTDAFFQSASANAIAAESYGQFMKMMLGDTLSYLGGLAVKKASFELAEGLAALAVTWGVPNPASINHFLAAAAYGSFGIGLQAGGAAISSSARGSGGGGYSSSTKQTIGSSAGLSANDNYRSSSISSSREEEKKSSPQVVNNYYIHGRSDLLTRKDIQQVAKRTSQGRS